MKKMPIAIFPGTFDPITCGHMELIERAVRLFGTLIVAVADNPAKETFFTLDERVTMVQNSIRAFPGIKVTGFSHLMARFAKEQQATLLIRGIRTINDFEYERQLADMNHCLNSELETIFLMPSAKNNFISSSIVRDIARHHGDVSDFVPPYVNQKLQNKYKLGDLPQHIK